MTEVMEVYKCDICGNVVEMVHNGVGELVCCGKPMVLKEEKSGGEGKEKHLPVIEQREGKTIVSVGEIEHPMEENHYIEWIELIANGKVFRKQLSSGDKPIAEFCVVGEKARVYCNVHGLWVKLS
jgi:superoxide reductase